MSFIETTRDQCFFDQQASALGQMIKENRAGEFTRVDLREGWQIFANDKRQGDTFKLTYYHPGLGIMVKIFSSCTDDYAAVTFQALRETALLPLRIKILGPIGKSDRCIFFELGTYHSTNKLRTLVDLNDITQITDVATRHGLRACTLSDKVDLVVVRGEQFIVDPLDDSANSILRYQKR